MSVTKQVGVWTGTVNPGSTPGNEYVISKSGNGYSSGVNGSSMSADDVTDLIYLLSWMQREGMRHVTLPVELPRP